MGSRGTATRFQTDDPKIFMSRVMQASATRDRFIDSMWHSITFAEARWAIEQLYKAAQEGEQHFSERFRKIIRASQGDVQADPGLLEMMSEFFNEEQLAHLAEAIKCSASSFTKITNSTASCLTGMVLHSFPLYGC